MKNSETCTEISDAMLLLLFRQNEKQAFTLLYQKYRPPLLSFSFRYLNDKSVCEDIVQELFAQFYSKKHSLKIRSSLSAYMFTSLKRKILNHLREQAVYKKHVLIYDHHSPKSINNLESYFDSADLEKTIRRLLHRLPEKYRDIYTLQYKHELSIKKVSGLLNTPVSTVEKQARKLTCFLRENLKVSPN